MKKLTIMLAGLGVAVAALPATAVNAQGWQSINQRQANLERRIDQGVRRGDLTRNEARNLRAEFRTLQNLEYRYRRSGGGLSNWERRDLNQRFDRLSAKIRWERHDRNNRRRY